MPDAKIIALLQSAVAHHQAGQLETAETIYKQVLKVDSANADALNLLGMIAFARGQFAEAKDLSLRAVKAAPQMADARFNLGVVLAARGEKEAALEAYRGAVAIKSDHAGAQLNMGVVLQQLGKPEEALAAFRKSDALSPADPGAHFNLGECLRALARHTEAEASLLLALKLKPSFREAHESLAAIYMQADRLPEAIHHAREVVALNPTPESHSNLGDLLKRAGEMDAALAAHRTALASRPDDPALLHNYGSAQYAARRLDEARATFEHAISADPSFVRGYAGLAKIYEHRGEFDVAVELLQKALSLDPGSAETIFKLSYCYLVAGRFAEGWRDYEYRFAAGAKLQVKRAAPPPYWEGEDLAGKTILIWTEQGIGDQILYSSMIPDIIARAGKCIIECKDRLTPVYARSFPQATVTTYHSQAETATPPEGIDFQTPVASLGRFLRTDFAQFPRATRFMKADPARTAALRARYRAINPGALIVGLSWRSNNGEIGEIKSTNLALWSEVLKVPGVTFINLQYGDCTEELNGIRRTMNVDIVADSEIDPLKNMDDFFAQAAAMDLVISTSNTTVHVAGSLGVPTWLLLLSSPADLWYWFRERTDSPWYASVRILRQELLHESADPGSRWRDGLLRIANELNQLAVSGIDQQKPPLLA